MQLTHRHRVHLGKAVRLDRSWSVLLARPIKRWSRVTPHGVLDRSSQVLVECHLSTLWPLVLRGYGWAHRHETGRVMLRCGTILLRRWYVTVELPALIRWSWSHKVVEKITELFLVSEDTFL